ncbi:hypothetical protein SAMN05421839_11840 [Halolactibacillus halophilus]|uniref:Lipoprotein n=1 Tax=Halolactibacillus halophilus TaxID=306540 RepID=A0A1I5Q3S5_9BACI|nr:hypothetical protein [Halolactibacillus halophilus]GEM02913.1 hypothetical protein HHA03_24450 [Halolactibacillus halophilus]SFP40680.1 hypothetical protein SAMN05421839_11840 [Halolactibacillus halophilus]
MKKALLLIFMSLTLNACGQPEIIYFEGNGDHWEITHTVELLSEQMEQSKTFVKYIGEEPTPEMIDYTIETSTSKSKGQTTLKSDGTVVVGGSGRMCDSCTLHIDRNQVVNATISWDGNVEVIELNP